MLTTTLIRDYLVNYARSLIYTTALSYANVVAADCSFDMLENGIAEKVSTAVTVLCMCTQLLSQLSSDLLLLVSHFITSLNIQLGQHKVPVTILSLPPHLTTLNSTSLLPPIIPLLTAHPHSLSEHLLSLGLHARPITYPTVPKGKGRVRVCLHSGNSQKEVDILVSGCITWAKKELKMKRRQLEKNGLRVLVEAKL